MVWTIWKIEKKALIHEKKLSNNATKKSIFMDAHEAQEVDRKTRTGNHSSCIWME